MNKIKSYTSIWNIETVIYALGDQKLPFPITSTQIVWYVVTFVTLLTFRNVPPVSMIDNILLEFLIIPTGVSWLMSQKTFDEKKPHSYLKSLIIYQLQPKMTYANKPVKFKKERLRKKVTLITTEERSDQAYVISN